MWPCVGIDAPWMLDFNFGQRPFAFDVDKGFEHAEVHLDSVFDSFFKFKVPEPMVMPLVPRFSERQFFGQYVASYMRRIVLAHRRGQAFSSDSEEESILTQDGRSVYGSTDDETM